MPRPSLTCWLRCFLPLDAPTRTSSCAARRWLAASTCSCATYCGIRVRGTGHPALPDPAFQLLQRWLIRLDGDRHRRVRDAFGGLFTARRVGHHPTIIAERAAALIDLVAPAGSMEAPVGYPGGHVTLAGSGTR
jgi:hypothetical protein